MISTKTSTGSIDFPGTGRASEQVYTSLRRKVLDGVVRVGSYLPTERQLSAEFNVAHTTIRRALAKLQVEGLIRSEPRKGYRVLGLANDPVQGCPVAYIRSVAGVPATWDEFHARLAGELQEAVDRKGWPLVSLGEGVIHSAKVLSRLTSSRAWAVILDSNDPAAYAAVKSAGLPVLMVDSWLEGSGIDSVLQDGHHGGMIASRSLVENGCRRIAWFGPAARNVHVLDRFGGFCAGLLNHNIPVSSNLIFSPTEAEVLASARNMFSGSKRPDGVVAFWGTYASAVAQAAAERGLVLNKDVHLVGWTPNEMYSRFASMFSGIPTPPAITWDIRAMSDAAAAILLERRANPDMPELRVRVPVRLRLG